MINQNCINIFADYIIPPMLKARLVLERTVHGSLAYMTSLTRSCTNDCKYYEDMNYQNTKQFKMPNTSPFYHGYYILI